MEVKTTGTKNPAGPKIATMTVDGETVGTIDLTPRDFKTGSKGYWGNGKIMIGGKRYQVGANVVEIGSKPKPKA